MCCSISKFVNLRIKLRLKDGWNWTHWLGPVTRGVGNQMLVSSSEGAPITGHCRRTDAQKSGIFFNSSQQHPMTPNWEIKLADRVLTCLQLEGEIIMIMCEASLGRNKLAYAVNRRFLFAVCQEWTLHRIPLTTPLNCIKWSSNGIWCIISCSEYASNRVVNTLARRYKYWEISQWLIQSEPSSPHTTILLSAINLTLLIIFHYSCPLACRVLWSHFSGTTIHHVCSTTPFVIN